MKRPENIPEELRDTDLLFHYSKPYVAMENILYNGEIRFSSLINMNDPYENKIPSLGVSGRSISNKTFSEISRKLRKDILFKSKILSLVRSNGANLEDDFQLVFTRPRLWAQYGERHYGVCLIFSLKEILTKIKSTFPHLTVYHDYVTYNLRTGGRSHKSHLRHDQTQSSDKNIRNHIDANKRDIFFRKYKDFRDENEYRIVLIDWADDTNSDIYINLQGVIKGVILGERFHLVYEELIKPLVKNLNAPLYRICYGNAVFIKKYKS